MTIVNSLNAYAVCNSLAMVNNSKLLNADHLETWTTEVPVLMDVCVFVLINAGACEGCEFGNIILMLIIILKISEHKPFLHRHNYLQT
jgi:hypothetical protein